MKIRKNDNVIVVAGKSKGKRGRVHRVFPRDDLVLVEGVNIIKRHMRPRAGVRQAGIVEREAPIHISNVMLICAKCGQATRVGFQFLEDGTKVRVCRHCHETID